jgi:outer membrane receptor protein involved in Fe transport
MRYSVGGSAVRALLLASTTLALAGVARAQTARPPEQTPADSDVVVVVGSQIVGAQPTEALPVVVVGEKELDAIAASSGDDLFRSIPQLGDVSFGSASVANSVGGTNAARGDTASINLRALGTGNTLVLLNGRRMVNHPGTQAENLVPVVTANTNAIPTSGIKRVEVLLDGASAIYGADAVAGVVNTVLNDDFEGLMLDVTYGNEEGASADEFTASMQLGIRSNDGATRLSVMGSYFSRDPIYASDREFSASSDRRSRLPADWAANAAASAGFNNTSITSAWGVFDKLAAGNILVNGAAVTNAAGQFHIQPSSIAGCAPTGALSADTCIGTTSTRPQGTRYNVNEDATVTNGVDRINLFSFFNQDSGDNLELFAEAGVYLADSVGYREVAPMLGAVPIVIPSTNYYNPFGAVGSANRLAGYTGPALDLYLGSAPGAGTAAYRPIDVGPRKTEVENLSTRLLVGLRGDFADWDWESALLYSEASTKDREMRVSNTLFQQALGRSTPDAYNPFNGGCVGDLASGDCTRNPRAVIDSFLVPVTRKNNTSLASWDLKLSRPDVFTLWAGDVGAAIGVETRRETYSDDRDIRQDGTAQFTDIISGLTTNDLQGNSASRDTRGSTNVQSGYVELQVPLVSNDMAIPLVQSIDMQLAARYEHFDTFGDVTKPKVALSWRPFDFLLFRSAWSEGFRAPNLQQQNETGLQRINNRTDLIFCEADLRAGRITQAQFTTTCPTRPQTGVTSNRQGSQSLQPEESTNLSYGFVLESTFMPEEWGKVSFTADWWRIEQENVVGIFGDDNHILLDYVLRLNGGSNSAVVRAAPDADDIAAFAGTGIAPVGDILFVNDNYLNLDKRTVQGLDLGLYYDLDDTPVGNFSFRVNAALLDKFFQGVSPNGEIINAAVAAGDISTLLGANGQGDLIRDFGRPEWRYSASLSWDYDAWGAAWFTSYVGDVYDDFNTLNGQPWIIDEYQTHNLYVHYEFDHDTDAPMRVRVGARNLFDETPPLADTNFGFLGELHNPQGRFVYVNVRKTF